ncbi:MAG: UDP-3-O-(3-hydroxymyristoyl)glucosamine N-acyltransferase [Kangiellaceae bacterium]|nr:UDP-3-O-(3-hydroxymyristoyl)glucosamine N-acyltransferase [Kangiellaceae bacterium]MCW9017506.1 UDP-3-O-(3-hydroxymyristoyl)glucosamine N-acyltransferase [Kangiellaceae bacterium]
MSKVLYSVSDLAAYLKASYRGNGEHSISSIAPLDQASSHQISFLTSSKFKAQLDSSQAGCVLLCEDDASGYNGNCIVLDDPYLGFAKVAQLLDTTPVPELEINRTASIAISAKIAEDVCISPGCVIEDDVVIEQNVILGPNVVVGKGTTIGQGTRIFSNVSIYHNVQVGKSCLIHAGAVIGADGFGFANEKGEWVKIPQMGRVIIGDNVELGANTCVDRGALNDTILGDGVKLDNFCHIAHNVVLGKHVAMAAYAGVAGSTKVGDFCTFSGRSTILGHLEIAPGTHVTACSVINRSNKEAGVFSSGTGMQDNKAWRKNVARFRQLDDMAKQMKQLQKQIKELQNK